MNSRNLWVNWTKIRFRERLHRRESSGGAHKVMVKAAKKAIHAVLLSSSDVTDEELITVVTGTESLLNSRPLTYQSANIRDDVPLTPNYFLHGKWVGSLLQRASTLRSSTHGRGGAKCKN